MDKPVVQLSGEDGNVYGVIASVMKALKKAGQHDKAKDFASKAFQCGSYDAVLQLCFNYVDVQ